MNLALDRQLVIMSPASTMWKLSTIRGELNFMNVQSFVRASKLLMILSLAACKGEATPAPEAKGEPKIAEPQKAAPESPKADAPKPVQGAAAAPVKANEAAPSLAAPGAGQEAPEVSEGKSGPPTVAEWQAAASANTVGANSAPRDCELKAVREWLKINCTGKIKEITNMEGFGQKNLDYFELVTPGRVADFVVRMKKGKAMKMRIIREDQSASLFVNWPQQSAKPSIIALQIFNP